MNNLIDIQGQIEKLQKQAAEIKDREFARTVQDIRAKMQAFGITIKDLQTGTPVGRKGKAAGSAKVKLAANGKKKTGAVVAAKFRGPNGETWSGRGLTPRWLAALVAQGQSKDDFAIKN